MKYSLMAFLAIVVLLSACADASESKVGVMISQKMPDEVQSLLRKSIEELVFVEGGRFQMGDFGAYITQESFNKGGFDYEFVEKEHPDSMWIPWLRPDFDLKRQTAEPLHEVTLSSYSIAQYEVTFEDFDIYSRFTGAGLLAQDIISNRGRASIKPARYMTWQQARDYCLWLGVNTGLSIDLPTEAQWEYAARSRGKKVAYGTDTGMPNKGVNIGSGLGSEAVGSYPPNPLGLYDMSANVKEWVLDWFDPDYYAHSPKVDPQGPDHGSEKVVRGGKVVLQRYHEPPISSPEIIQDFGYEGRPDVGFRCVVNAPQPVQLK